MSEILFLAHRIPYPPTKGDKIRSYHIFRHLAERNRVHLGCFIDDPDDWRHVDELRAQCGESCFIRLDPLRARLRGMRGLLTGEPLTVPYYFNSGMQQWIDELLSANRIDGVLVFSSSMAQFVVGRLPAGIRLVVDFVDIDSDKWSQYSRERTFPMSWLYRREADRLLEYERRVAMQAHSSFFVSSAEAHLFRSRAPESAPKVTHICNGVDTEYFSPDVAFPDPFKEGEKAIVFTGAMDYWPNIDAVQWFADQVLPGVRSRDPAARFYIVGSRPDASVVKLAEREGIVVTGTVPDTRPYIAHAHAAVAPLRVARGVQNKVLEAMAMARPIVVSDQALSGIDARPGTEVLLAEFPDEWVSCLGELLSEPGNGVVGARIGKAARARVASAYQWQANLCRLDTLLQPAPDVSAGPNAESGPHADSLARPRIIRSA